MACGGHRSIQNTLNGHLQELYKLQKQCSSSDGNDQLIFDHAHVTGGEVLDQYDVSNTPNNATAYVRSVRDYYVLQKTPTESMTVDNISILSVPGLPNARWVRLNISDPSWLYEPNWTISPSGGNDESVTGLATWAEFMRRTGMLHGHAQFKTTVTVGIVEDLDECVTVRVAPNVYGTLIVEGFVSGVGQTYSAKVDLDLEVGTGLGVNPSLTGVSTTVGSLVKLDGSEAKAWVLSSEVNGSPVVDLTNWLITDDFGYIQSVNAPAAPNEVVVYEVLPQITRLNIDVSDEQGSNPVCIKNLSIGTIGTTNIGGVPGLHCVIRECRIDVVFLENSDLFLHNCLVGGDEVSFVVVRNGARLFARGGGQIDTTLPTVINQQGYVCFDYNHIFWGLGTGVFVGSGGYLEIGTCAGIGAGHAFGAGMTTQVVYVELGGRLGIVGGEVNSAINTIGPPDPWNNSGGLNNYYLWGNSSSVFVLYGVVICGEGFFKTTPAGSLTGSAGDIWVGGTIRTWLDPSYFDTNTLTRWVNCEPGVV